MSFNRTVTLDGYGDALTGRGSQILMGGGATSPALLAGHMSVPRDRRGWRFREAQRTTRSRLKREDLYMAAPAAGI